ncbi:putative bromodomain-containing protein [Phaeoacremonium minimum UCRPA7]|uniref:SAGA complex subunit Spt7 n=1 Tax=Phaeoacremonium minimum (strain UCR-PA7) TaxID=1286976 RepID=R8BFD0_PHAM7|nr:putative bromodomain-containing protein [Phaeoacremonium minimum UCRPA7]EON97999.1 putative bromodomain-containing protein [Phaeoacremonium minimum UCRPA7]
MNQLVDDGSARTQTPVDNAMTLMPEASDIELENRRAQFAELYRKSESKIALLFAEDGSYNRAAIESFKRPRPDAESLLPPTTDHAPIQEPPLKKAKRVIDEDDYGDDDEDEEEEEETQPSPLKAKSASVAAAKTLLSPSKSGSSPVQSISSPGKSGDKSKDDGSQGQAKSSEDARKALEEARNATEEAAKRSFHTLFYTLENDRTAMLEQQQLEESEKQLQAEMDKNGGNSANNGPGQNHGSLSNANLGASSLTLKHLIARIDMKRSQVRASDAELRSLMNEVRKNRSKWASEENVGQEELYEALEKVLSELKAHTEYSTPFLQRVNKRDAPDYYNIIKQPMDLGSMTKKLKGLQYKSKAEFVTDLNLIWDNCLRYNQDMTNHLRRMANGMRKEAEKLIPLIPDLVVRPRAEVEAEERRKQNGGDDDGGDDSDDEPIMSSRGRKTGAKGTGTKSRKAPSDQKEDTPNVEQKPLLQLNGLLAKSHREGSELGDGSNGFATPPIGSITPSGLNGQSGIGSNADAMDIDGPSLNGMALNQALGEAVEQEFEDEEYKIWKQVTKKDRALVAKDRFQLFKGNKLNLEEPALLRTKAAMRRYLRSQKQAESAGVIIPAGTDSSAVAAKESSKPTETLAEGMEDEEEKVIPDYYEPQSLIPDIPPKLQWIEDSEGQVINQHEEYLRLIPEGQFISPASRLTKKFDANIRQMQETRKLCSKIGVIKQMQIQTQVYTNQFPKYNPEPFIESDIEPNFISGDGPVMAPELCRSAMQRSVAKIFYHAGFEELQPSALDTITDVAADYFGKLVKSFNVYHEAEKKDAVGVYAERGAKFQPRFTPEEVLLHTLSENGHDIESLESYAKDEVDRLSTKLGVIHERMKAHLADLLRPALNDAGPDGAGAFKDGSEQFVGGDFAEELGEDFFGFKALGLDKEMGLDMMSVPLHLLQSRVRSQFQSQAQAVGTETADLFEPLAPPDPVTRENIQEQIGLVKNFFLAKLHANGDQPLVEDEDLPVKQRRPRPRLGATGKIVSPQKRPPKEQIALAKKKKKLESGGSQVTDGKGANATPEKISPSKKLKSISLPNGAGPSNGAVAALQAPAMERVESMQSQGNASQTDKDDAVGMMSPESIQQ